MRLQPIRTAAEITAHIKIQPAQQVPLYQKLTQKATKLRLLGMSYIFRKEFLFLQRNSQKLKHQ